MSKNKHIGSDFDAFVAEQGEHEEATAVAVKRVIAWADRAGDANDGREQKAPWPSACTQVGRL